MNIRGSFVFLIIISSLAVILVLNYTSFHEKYKCFTAEEREDNLWHLLIVRFPEAMNHLMIEKWGWRPTGFGILNVVIGVIHVFTIVLIVPLLFTLILLMVVVLYICPVLIGTISGLVVGCILSLVFNIVSGNPMVWLVFPEICAVKGAYIALYSWHAYLIGSILHWLLVGPDYSQEPAKYKGGIKMDELEKEIMKALALPEPQVLVSDRPFTTQEASIPQEITLAGVHDRLNWDQENQGLLKTIISAWVERRKDDAQTRAIMTRLTRIELEEKVLNAIQNQWEAYGKLVIFHMVQGIRKMEFEAKIQQMEYESRKAEQAAQHEMQIAEHRFRLEKQKLESEELELRVKQAKLLLASGNGDREKVDPDVKKIQQISNKLLFIQETMDNLREKYRDDPEKLMEVLDRFDKMLVEEEVIGDID
jgi:hypothetical protein